MSHVSEHEEPARVDGVTESEKRKPRDKTTINRDSLKQTDTKEM